MFKTKKGKVNGGIFLVLLFSGGIALGNSDAGIALQRWYDQLFSSTAEVFNSDYKKYLGDRLAEIENDKLTLESLSNNAIDGTKETVLNNTKQSIQTATNEKINSLNTKKGEISSYMAKQFDDLLAAATEVINQTSSETLTDNYDNLSTKTQEKGADSLSNVENDLAMTEEDAIDELELEIEKAKTELRAQLESEKIQTDAEVKIIIDNKIAELKALIVAKKDELTTIQQNIIINRAQELENSIKQKLDSTVDGI